MEIKLNTPIKKEDRIKLTAGDSVLLSGIIYTARDAAHERMYKTGKFPIDLSDQVIYYAGPCPAKPGEVIGSCGPTTSGRMDKYTPLLLDNGLGAMIGKGARNKEVIEAMKRNGCVYFGAIGGAGALIAKCIKETETVAYSDLGTEAVRRLVVEDFPVIVLIDAKGNDLYKTQIEKYKKQ